jgi:quercetin dioxygenase-like cupin family protein
MLKTAVVLAPLMSVHLARAQGSQPAQGFGTCIPASERAGRDVGCFIVTEQRLGRLDPARAYWHVTRFPTRADAERENVTGRNRGTVIEAFDGSWLLTIADSVWRPRSGDQVAAIGPLPITRGTEYSALYMEATMRPGMKSAVHRHSGPEVWYTMSGETCLESPGGTQVGRVGNPVIVPGGQPMELTATGTETRRSIVLILHDASRPPTMMESKWKPRGLCSQ